MQRFLAGKSSSAEADMDWCSFFAGFSVASPLVLDLYPSAGMSRPLFCCPSALCFRSWVKSRPTLPAISFGAPHVDFVEGIGGGSGLEGTVSETLRGFGSGGGRRAVGGSSVC